jgi:hypothetical protein
VYDDTDVRVVRKGDWFRDFCCATFDRSLSTSRKAGDELRFTFEGTKAAVLFIRGPNFGVADLLVDGAVQSTIDEYAAVPAYRLRETVDVPGGGLHTLSVRVAARKNAAAADVNFAVDGFQVW